MHPILASFNRKAVRPKYNGTDSLTVDGEKVIFGRNMMPIQVELSEGQMNNVIRLVKTADVSRVQSVSLAVLAALGRLRSRRDLRLTIANTPLGSDQHDLGSFVTWTKQITRADRAAVAQLRVIDATATARLA